MKIIDFEKNGNVVLFFVGKDDLSEWYGDDWNDAPYEHNAETVYDEFVSAYFDVAWDGDWLVMEPCDGTRNSYYCKDDMREQKVPCIVVSMPDENDYADFARYVADLNAYKIYFGEAVEKENAMCYGFHEGRVLKWVDVEAKT